MGDLAEVWTGALQRLRDQVDVDTYQRYLVDIVPLGQDHGNGTVRLGVMNELMELWLNANYRDIITEVLEQTLGHEVSVLFEAGHVREAPPAAPRAAPVPTVTAEPPSLPYRPDFTFDTFVVGDNNRIAFAAAEAVAKKPGKSYNPLFIYGGTSLGKTHLLQAIANEIALRRKRARIEYLTSEEFLNRYVEALGNKTLPSFRRHYRSLDVLLIDDVQFFKGKGKLGEEFFHTFNTLHNAHKQIVLAADRTPQELEDIEQRLVSRFGWGLSAEVRAPNLETRMAILKKKQQMQRIKLDDEVLRLVAERIRSNIRQLEGALTILVMNVSTFGGHMTPERAEELLRDKFENEAASRALSIETIQRCVAEHFDIRMADMYSRRKPRFIAEPRMIAMYLARKLTDHSLPVIGEAFSRNHATVLHAVDRIEERMGSNDEFRSTVGSLARKLQS